MKSLENFKQDAIDYCNKLQRKSWFIKTICLLIIWTIATIPFDIYLLFRLAFDPVGFWQNIALLIVWAILLGWLQALALILGVATTIHVIDQHP